MQNATEVQALVALNSSDCDDTCSWQPTLKFQSRDGQTISARTLYASPDYGWPEGTTVTVWHNPDFPHVYPVGPLNLWFFAAGFFGLGLLAMGIGGWLMARMVFSRVPRGD